MTKYSFLILLAGQFLNAVASADELYMRNGSHLIGELVSAGDGTVIFRTPFAGSINIKVEDVDTIVTGETVTLLMKDGTVYKNKRIIAREDRMVVMKQDKVPVMFESKNIERVNPEPWQLGEGYKWFGSTSLSLEVDRGNSDSDEWDGDARSVWRSLDDRYSIRGDFEIDKTNNRKTKDNWTLRAKYDRFRNENPENFLGVKSRLEYDNFNDLDLRTMIGAHIGRQFSNTSQLSLEAEVGPVWVDEQFDAAEDDDWPGAHWSVEAQSDILGFGTTLYLDHDGTLNFNDIDSVLLNATIGVRFPLVYGFEASVEADYEYNGGAVENVDDMDESYKFKIGYSW